MSKQRSELLQYVGRQTQDSALSEDIVQEAYVRLIMFQAKPESQIRNASALLRRISINLLRDHFRYIKRTPLVELSETLPCDAPTADLQLERRQLISLVGEVLKTMPPLRREVFIRRRVHGQTASDVSRALGASPSAVSNHVARAILDLDVALEKIEQRGENGQL